MPKHENSLLYWKDTVTEGLSETVLNLIEEFSIPHLRQRFPKFKNKMEYTLEFPLIFWSVV